MNKEEHTLWIKVSKSFESDEQTDIIMNLHKRLDEAEQHIRELELSVNSDSGAFFTDEKVEKRKLRRKIRRKIMKKIGGQKR